MECCGDIGLRAVRWVGSSDGRVKSSGMLFVLESGVWLLLVEWVEWVEWGWCDGWLVGWCGWQCDGLQQQHQHARMEDECHTATLHTTPTCS